MNGATFTDYYAVLGVPADADLDTIKGAYRRLAMLNHPDRGGTHEKMLLINEAFQLLANPVARADYDRARASASDAQAQHDAQAAVNAAAAQAANYPPHSTDIDSWMDGLAKDFLAASYGKSGMWPTIKNSTSGWLFLIGGGAVGAWIGTWIGYQFFGPAAGRGLLLFAAGGATVAQLLHRGIRDSMSGTTSSRPMQPQATQGLVRYDFAKCPQCNQQLRYPADQAEARLRCPKCQCEFSATGPTSGPSIPAPTTPQTSAENKGMTWGIITAIVAGIILYNIFSTTYSGGLFGSPSTETNWVVVIGGTLISALVAYNIGKKSEVRVQR